MVRPTLGEDRNEKRRGGGQDELARTFFPDQTVVTVVGVVGVTQSSMTVFEFKEFVAVFSGMSSAGGR